MKIVLVRHGPPEFNTPLLMPTSGAKNALDLYAASRVKTDSPLDVRNFISLADICVTSELARAIDSAQALGFKDCIASNMFNESELPHPNRLLVPLPWRIFLLIYRLLWFFGFSQNWAGVSLDRKRARKGSKYLSELAIENDLVLLVGRGIINRLLCAKLQNSGWQIEKKHGSGYWSLMTLSRQTTGSERTD